MLGAIYIITLLVEFLVYGIENKDPRYNTDLCHRSPDPTKGQKQAVIRTTGLTDLYKRVPIFMIFLKRKSTSI